MLLREAILSYAHFLAIIAIGCTIMAELLLFRKSMPAGIFHRLRMVDRWYGITAGLVVLTGLLRLNLGIKGVPYYTGNPVFWTKMGLFVAVGLISIVPTVAYIRWSRGRAAGEALELSDGQHSRIRGLLWLQAGLFACIPLCASLMAFHL